MNLAGLQFWTKAGHHVLVLLNTSHSRKSGALNEHFIVIFSSGQVVNLDFALGIMGL